MGLGDALLSSLPGWASQALGLAEILIWGSHQGPWSECCPWAEQLLGTTARELQKASGMWHVITLGPLASCAWLGHMKYFTVPVSELKRTNTISISLTNMNARYFSEEYQRKYRNPRLACASCEEWGNNPMYLGDLWRQLRQSYNWAVADTQLIAHLLQPCGWYGLGAPAGCQAWASEVGELNSGHWSTRDLLAPRNTSWRELSQVSASQQ